MKNLPVEMDEKEIRRQEFELSIDEGAGLYMFALSAVLSAHEKNPDNNNALGMLEEANKMIFHLGLPDEFRFVGDAVMAQVLRYKTSLLQNINKDKPGHLYLIKHPVTGHLKIGFSKNLSARLAQLQCNIPLKLIVLHTKAGTQKEESALHRLFAKQRTKGEWFEDTPELRNKFINT